MFCDTRFLTTATVLLLLFIAKKIIKKIIRKKLTKENQLTRADENRLISEL